MFFFFFNIFFFSNWIIFIIYKPDYLGNYKSHYDLYNGKGEKINARRYRDIIDTYDNYTSAAARYYIGDFTGEDGNTKYDLLDEKGQVVYGEVDGVFLKSTKFEQYFAAVEKDGKWTIYNLNNGKEIGSYTEKPELIDYYYYVKEGEKSIYYTYLGNKFYEK